MWTNTTLTERDKAYVRSEFVELDELCKSLGKDANVTRAEFEAGRRSKPAYRFEDGAEYVARDYFEQVTSREAFAVRYRARAEELGEPCAGSDVEEAWEGYLSGGFGVCLRHASPEGIVEKSYRVARIEALTRAPREYDERWRGKLKAHVDALDALVRPFCDYDRAFFGGPVSRDTYITDIRVKYSLR